MYGVCGNSIGPYNVKSVKDGYIRKAVALREGYQQVEQV